jgi:hypothetical protein
MSSLEKATMMLLETQMGSLSSPAKVKNSKECCTAATWRMGGPS